MLKELKIRTIRPVAEIAQFQKYKNDKIPKELKIRTIRPVAEIAQFQKYKQARTVMDPRELKTEYLLNTFSKCQARMTLKMG